MIVRALLIAADNAGCFLQSESQKVDEGWVPFWGTMREVAPALEKAEREYEGIDRRRVRVTREATSNQQ